MGVSTGVRSTKHRASKTTITLLYQVRPGLCSRSFGLNVARLAGVPPQVVAAADVAAERMKRAGLDAARRRAQVAARVVVDAVAAGTVDQDIRKEAQAALNALEAAEAANTSNDSE